MPGPTIADDERSQRLAVLEAEVSRLRHALAAKQLSPGLSKREALLVEAERVAHMGSWVWNLNTGEIGWSDEFYRILGLRPGNVEPTSAGFFGAWKLHSYTTSVANARTSSERYWTSPNASAAPRYWNARSSSSTRRNGPRASAAGAGTSPAAGSNGRRACSPLRNGWHRAAQAADGQARAEARRSRADRWYHREHAENS